MAGIEQRFAPIIARFSGFARDYDRHRPRHPQRSRRCWLNIGVRKTPRWWST
jgi:hypothetical protein